MIASLACFLGLLGAQEPQEPPVPPEVKVVSAAGKLSVLVDDVPVAFSGVGPRRVAGRVLVPLRGVLEKVGATVDWNPDLRTVTALRGTTSIVMKIGERTATVGDRRVSLDVPAQIIGGATMVPLRFMGEALGSEVLYVQAIDASKAMIGTWFLLDSEERFVRTTKIVFSPSGTFLFQGSAWKSTGTYQAIDDRVTLTWGAVDGQPVDPPGSMVKTLPIAENYTRFQLDRFRYGKS